MKEESRNVKAGVGEKHWGGNTFLNKMWQSKASSDHYIFYEELRKSWPPGQFIDFLGGLAV